MCNFEKEFLYNNFGCNKTCNKRCSSCIFYKKNILDIRKKLNDTYKIADYYLSHSALATAEYLNKEYNTHYFTNGKIMNIIKSCGLPLHSIKDANNLESAKKQREATNLRIYGAVNPLSRGTTVFEKRNNTVKQRYGVDNVFQVDSVKEKIVKSTFEHFGCYSQAAKEVHSKTVKTMMDKFGCWSYHTEDARAKNLEKQKGNKHWISKPDLMVQDFLIENNIDFQIEKTFFNKENHGWAIVDILVGNTAFEVQGTYWHADPRFYKKDDIFQHNKTAEDIWARDSSKKLFLESFGLKVVYLWQEDIINNFDIIKSLILENI